MSIGLAESTQHCPIVGRLDPERPRLGRFTLRMYNGWPRQANTGNGWRISTPYNQPLTDLQLNMSNGGPTKLCIAIVIVDSAPHVEWMADPVGLQYIAPFKGKRYTRDPNFLAAIFFHS